MSTSGNGPMARLFRVVAGHVRRTCLTIGGFFGAVRTKIRRTIQTYIPAGVRRFIRRFAGAEIGIAVGIVMRLGLFGVFLGGIIGLLIDEVRSKRNSLHHIDRFYRTGEIGELSERSAWLSGIVALSGRLVLLSDPKRETGERAVRGIERSLMINRIAAALSLTSTERETVEGFCERFFERNAVDSEAIATALRGLASGDGELEGIILLLHNIAPGEGNEITAAQREFIRAMASRFGMPEDRANSLQETASGIDTEAYRILGVPPSASTPEIKRVYRQLAAHFHPDAGGELDREQRRQSEEAYIRIQDAYNRIMARRGAQRKNVDPEMD